MTMSDLGRLRCAGSLRSARVRSGGVADTQRSLRPSLTGTRRLLLVRGVPRAAMDPSTLALTLALGELKANVVEAQPITPRLTAPLGWVRFRLSPLRPAL